MKKKIFVGVLLVSLLFLPLVFIHSIKEEHGNFTTYLIKFRGIITNDADSKWKRIWILVPVTNKEFLIMIPKKGNTNDTQYYFMGNL